MGIGIGGDDEGFAMGIGGPPQQPIFIPLSIGMPASIAPMAGLPAAGLPIPVIPLAGFMAGVDPELAGDAAAFMPGMPGMPPFCMGGSALADAAGNVVCKFGSTCDGGAEFVCGGPDEAAGMSMPPPQAATNMDVAASEIAMQKIGFMGGTRFLC